MPQLARARVLPACPDVAVELRGVEVEVLAVMFPCEDRCGAWWCQVRRPETGHQFEVLSNDLDPDPRGPTAPDRGRSCLGRRQLGREEEPVVTAAAIASALLDWSHAGVLPAPTAAEVIGAAAGACCALPEGRG